MFRFEHLAVCRLEPALSNREEAILDLVFERDGRFAVAPLAIVDSTFIVGRESSPFAWPASAADYFDRATIEALEASIEPWLRGLLLARFQNDETVKFVRDRAFVRDAFTRARRLKLLGASPLGEVLSGVAPAVYAYRFASGARVAFSDALEANAAALLYGRAASVHLATPADDDERFARDWFGTQVLEALDPDDTYDVAVVDDRAAVKCAVEIRRTPAACDAFRVTVARPLPLATFVSFDPEDSIAQSEFSVVVHEPMSASRISSVIEAPSVGGSAGRVALLVREDWTRADDADSDAIRALHVRLVAEGFSVRIIEGWSNVEPAEVDLVHVVGLGHSATIREKIGRLSEACVPIVTSPLADDPSGETPWGVPLAQSAFRNSIEDTTLDHYLGAIALRRLNADGVPLHSSLPLPPSADVSALLKYSGALIASSPSEETLLRERFGYAGPIVVVPPLIRSVPKANVDAIAGFGDFIFMHAAIDARSAVVMAALAAEAENLPLVLTGPVADAETMLFLHAFAGNSLRCVPFATLDDALVEGLYARARVYADISWSGRGLSRFARAGGYGASLVASASGNAAALWTDAIHVADPANLRSISAAFRAAWEASPKDRGRIAAVTAQLCDQRSALSATVQAYQYAAEAVLAPT